MAQIRPLAVQVEPSQATPRWETLPLPPNWEKRRASNGRPYYVDHCTRKTHWLHPHNPDSPWSTEPLPAGWEIWMTSENNIYYVDHNTKSTSLWDPRYPVGNWRKPPLEDCWEMRRRPDGEVYWLHTDSGIQTDLDPRHPTKILSICVPLPPDWEMKSYQAIGASHLRGEIYFENMKTGEITWSDPRNPPYVPMMIPEQNEQADALATRIEAKRAAYEDARRPVMEGVDRAQASGSRIEAEGAIPRKKKSSPFDEVYGFVGQEEEYQFHSRTSQEPLPTRTTAMVQKAQSTRSNTSFNPFRAVQNQPTAEVSKGRGRAMRAYLSDL
ncbi:hypothetical protein CALCODRAFT_500312 [Calocera cornea HHB12733]|uniref:WW domain-containing protein n=1 Tax=Calocera cornea HHB12733 TaxID=1353952 RepID=A0A165E4K0_9BASI|nr:hypothetical protein CALCODRAFT_500312 [Calocera cornea HHB12733]